MSEIALPCHKMYFKLTLKGFAKTLQGGHKDHQNGTPCEPKLKESQAILCKFL